MDKGSICLSYNDGQLLGGYNEPKRKESVPKVIMNPFGYSG